MRRAATMLLLALMLGAFLAAQDKSSDAKPGKAIRIGVAVLQNTSNRTIAVRNQQNQLVHFLNQINRQDDAKKGRAKLEAVALEASAASDAAAEAGDKDCDFILYTNLKDLREPGDPHMPVRVGPEGGEITTTDPLRVPEHPVGSLNPASYALVGFRLNRAHDPRPLVASSVSATEQMDAEATVSLLMMQIASRAATEARKTRPPEVQ
jgi:hypothetical protein